MNVLTKYSNSSCTCGNDDSSKVIVQFYEDHDNGQDKDPLKIPICLGVLISARHVLTTKSCFGDGNFEVSFTKNELIE